AMSDDASLNLSCMRAVGAALLDAADIGGATGEHLCRALTEFATFSNQLDEEIASFKKEQLEKTLKSMEIELPSGTRYEEESD
ncbi:hypothetical protein PMAYCL1PPCAC_13830, partial [Pristionchus mayeri]